MLFTHCISTLSDYRSTLFSSVDWSFPIEHRHFLVVNIVSIDTLIMVLVDTTIVIRLLPRMTPWCRLTLICVGRHWLCSELKIDTDMFESLWITLKFELKNVNYLVVFNLLHYFSDNKKNSGFFKVVVCSKFSVTSVLVVVTRHARI